MKEMLWQLLAVWLGAMNGLGFLLMGLDKRRAVKGRWRISERGLFLPALLGGTVGSILGMRLFRHKTRHWYFRWGLPALLAAQLLLAVWLAWRFL